MQGQSNGVHIDHEGVAYSNQRAEWDNQDKSKSPSPEYVALHNRKRETDRVDGSTIIVGRLIESLSRDDTNMEVAMGEIEINEGRFFSPVPDYLLKQWKDAQAGDTYTPKNFSKVNGTAALVEERNIKDIFRDKGRIVINPRVPLMMPFNKQRFDANDNRKKNIQGNYHGLFFDDGVPVVFTPPKENKRQEVAKAAKEVAMWKARLTRPERKEVKTPVKKILKVSKDFIPLCAQVDDTAARESLLKKQEYAKLHAIKRHRFIVDY